MQLLPLDLLSLIERHWLLSVDSPALLEAYHLTDRSRVERYSHQPAYLIPILRANLRHCADEDGRQVLLQMLVVNEATESLHNLFPGWIDTSLRNWLPRNTTVESVPSLEMDSLLSHLSRRLLQCYSLVLGCYPLGRGFQQLRPCRMDQCEICLLHNIGKHHPLRHGMQLLSVV
jgi:hypothetical protein